MSSPFPGMNPYLERQSAWDSFHTLFIGETLKRLVPSVFPKYEVRSGSRLYIHEPSADERRYFASADVGIVSGDPTERGPSESNAAVALPKYRAIPACVVQEKIGYVEIREAEGDEVVTVIELLSRTNKIPKEDRELFLNKRHEILNSPANYVEINLLRAGRPLPFVPPIHGPYYVAVSRPESRDRVETWEWGVRESIPIIPIPLRTPDPDVAFDLKGVIEDIDTFSKLAPRMYTRRPDPPLSPEDEAWAKALIEAAT